MIVACAKGSKCGEPDCPVCTMNAEQKETFEILLSICEVQTLAFVDDEKAIVFEGEGQDGPCVGYIEIDGKVSWIVAG